MLVSSAAWHRERAKWNSGSGPSQAETILPGEAEAGVVWYERAEILHYSTVRDVTIRQVQCLTLLAAFQASVNAMPMAWLLAGQALRIGQDIGLPVIPFLILISVATDIVASDYICHDPRAAPSRASLLVVHLWP